jgi:hypothetical protein
MTPGRHDTAPRWFSNVDDREYHENLGNFGYVSLARAGVFSDEAANAQCC